MGMPDDERECLNDAGYIRDVHILVASYAVLLGMCGLTIVTRLWAARCYGLPLFATHICFLLLIMTALTMRLADLVLIPCFFTVEDGDTVWNFLANIPIMLMFTIFTMLLHHTFIVVHSIQLSYEPVLAVAHSTPSGANSPNRSLPAGGSPWMPSTTSGQSDTARDAWQAQTLWRRHVPGSPASPTPRTRQWRCLPNVPFWVVLCGRPHSSVKLMMLVLNAVMWLTFIAVLIVDSDDMLSIEFRNGERPSHFMVAVYLLEFPAVLSAVIISMCFIISGTKLLLKLRELRNILPAATPDSIDAIGGGASPDSNEAAPAQHPALIPGRVPTSVSIPRQPDHHGLKASDVRTSCSVPGQDDDATRYHSMPDLPRCRGGSPPVSIVFDDDQATPHPREDGSMSHRYYSHRSRSRITFSTLTASLSFVVGEHSIAVPSICPVMHGVKRMLVVVTACVGAFLFRASVILYSAAMSWMVFPRGMWLPYLLGAEVAPYALLLLFYFIPGVQAIYAGSKCCRLVRSEISASSIASSTVR